MLSTRNSCFSKKAVGYAPCAHVLCVLTIFKNVSHLVLFIEAALNSDNFSAFVSFIPLSLNAMNDTIALKLTGVTSQLVTLVH